MKKRQKIFFSLIFFSFAAGLGCSAQIGGMVSASSLRSKVEFLSSPLCDGRATESLGGMEAAFWISRQMQHDEVLPMGDSYMHSRMASGRCIRNIIGIVPSEKPSDRYIIIAAHYDNLGVLNGNYYPGADSNASGVAAMLSVARSLRGMKVLGKGLPVNVIFVALDAKQVNMLGAECLYSDLAAGRLRNPATGAVVRKSQVSMFVNIDILGGTLAPIRNGNPRYLIMLGGDESHRKMLRNANEKVDAGLQLGFDYYGSRDFTDLFYRRVSEQKVFIAHDIPSVMFTSGITMNTNRVADTAETLDFDVLRARVAAICQWLEFLAYSF